MTAWIGARQRRSQIPDKWKDAKLSDYLLTYEYGDPQASIQLAKWIESDRKQGLMFYGTPGCGKSMLACVAANAVLKDGGQPYFLPVQDLSSALYTRVSMREREEQERFDQLVHYITYYVDLLILDDMSSERASPTKYVEDRLIQIIRARGNAGKTLIVTSNSTPEQFAVRYGAATASFLYEVCTLVKVSASDYRKR